MNSAALNMTSIYIGVSNNYSLSHPSKKLGIFRAKSNFMSGTRNVHGVLGRSWHAGKKGRLQWYQEDSIARMKRCWLAKIGKCLNLIRIK